MTDCGCIEVMDIAELTGISPICDCNDSAPQRVVRDVEKTQIGEGEEKEEEEKLEERQASTAKESVEAERKGAGESEIEDKEQEQQELENTEEPAEIDQDKRVEEGRGEAEEQEMEVVKEEEEAVQEDYGNVSEPAVESSIGQSPAEDDDNILEPPVELPTGESPVEGDGNVPELQVESSIGQSPPENDDNIPEPAVESPTGESPVEVDGKSSMGQSPAEDDENIPEPPAESVVEAVTTEQPTQASDGTATDQKGEQTTCAGPGATCKCAFGIEPKDRLGDQNAGNVPQSPGEDDGNVPEMSVESPVGQMPFEAVTTEQPVETFDDIGTSEEGGPCRCASATEKFEREQFGADIADEGEGDGSCKCGGPALVYDRALSINVEDEGEKVSQSSTSVLQLPGDDTTGDTEDASKGAGIDDGVDKNVQSADIKVAKEEEKELEPKLPDSSNIKSCTCNPQVVIPLDLGAGVSTVIIVQGPNVQRRETLDFK